MDDRSNDNDAIWTVPVRQEFTTHEPIIRNNQFLDQLAKVVKRGPPSNNEASQKNLIEHDDAVPASANQHSAKISAMEVIDAAAIEAMSIEGEERKGIHINDENTVRGNWGSHIEFVLSCIGYAVGLGNVWRFPYLCYKNGGGSFLMIYWILSATVGLPIIFLELSLGQFTSQGPTGVWNYAPIVKGLGYSMCSISAIGAIYYNVVIAWALYYLFASFRSQLMWSQCDYNSWANYRCELPKIECTLQTQFRGSDGLCYSFDSYVAAREKIPRYLETICVNNNASVPGPVVPCIYILDKFDRNQSTVLGFWDEAMAADSNRGPQFASEQYFFRTVLGQDGKTDSRYSAVSLGSPQPFLALCLLLAWILVYLCLLNGIKSSGKVVYFTALFPYVILAVLIGKGLTLPGASEGILYFLLPNFQKMTEPNVWYAAASQLFFSLAACWGGMMALSSYNKFHTNTFRDALIVTAADTFTSFFASLAIFSVIGYGSHVLNKPVEEVADAGTGLAFILYPKIIDSLPGSVGWAITFFFMLVILGLDSEFNSLETIFTALLDKYPSLRSSFKKKAGTFALFCIPFFLLGLPLGGTQLLELVDEYGAGWGVFFIGIVEVLSVAWIYGTDRFSKDLSAMMPWLLNGARRAKIVPWVMRFFWGFVTPAILIFIMIFCWLQYKSREHIGEELLGWSITIFVMMWIPCLAVFIVTQQSLRRHGFWKGFKVAISASSKWGPYLKEHRRQIAAIHGDILTAVRSTDCSIDCVLDDDDKRLDKRNLTTLNYGSNDEENGICFTVASDSSSVATSNGRCSSASNRSDDKEPSPSRI